MEAGSITKAVIAALAGGKSVRAASLASGVSERTIYRRLKDPAFRKRLAEARAALLERAIGTLAEASTEAADTLRTLLKAKGESVRLAAARTILELGNKLGEAADLRGRLDALEQVRDRQHATGLNGAMRRCAWNPE